MILYDIYLKYFVYNKSILKILNYLNIIRWRDVDQLIILWPPAFKLINKILYEIKLHDFNILSMHKFKIDIQNFEVFLKELYEIDFADPKKIAFKLERLKKDTLIMYTIKINIKNPKIISQDYRNHVKCETIGDFKDHVRKKYKKNIQNYVYDIILHSTEIDYQIPLVESVIKKYTLCYEEIEINKNNSY